MSGVGRTLVGMPEGVDPGRETDRPDFRYCRPPRPCVGLVPSIATGGDPRWCDGSVTHWQRRRWGDANHVGPDGWWGYGEFQLEPGKRWRGWLHETELRPVSG